MFPGNVPTFRRPSRQASRARCWTETRPTADPDTTLAASASVDCLSICVQLHARGPAAQKDKPFAALSLQASRRSGFWLAADSNTVRRTGNAPIGWPLEPEEA